MFRPDKQCGLGNIMIWLSQLDDKIPVSESIYDGFRGKYLKFKNLNIMKDDGSLPTVCPPIYINPYTTEYVHPLTRNKLEPSDITMQHVNDNIHLLDNVCAGIAIKFGPSHMKFADDDAISNFENIIRTAPSPVFVTCDSQEYKHELSEKFPGKVRYIDQPLVWTTGENTVDSVTPYLEFFLLSSCPIIILTGGPRDMRAFSTFGYMAAIYGNKQTSVVWNKD